VLASFGSTVFEYCVFVNNTAIKHGGAVFVWKGALQVLDSTFEDNAALDLGGAVATQFGTAVYDRCSFQRNEGRYGGALAISLGCKGRVANSQFVYNPGMRGMLHVGGSSRFGTDAASGYGSYAWITLSSFINNTRVRLCFCLCIAPSTLCVPWRLSWRRRSGLVTRENSRIALVVERALWWGTIAS
jgi:hypothetical protein